MQQAPTKWDLSACLFPIHEKVAARREAWHEQYPSWVPPSMAYPSIRLEELMRLGARHYPARAAIDYFRTTLTYDELKGRVEQVAANLQRLGLEPGDRAMLVLPNCPEYVIAWFALAYLGVEIVHGSPLYSTGELERLTRAAQCKVVFGLDARIGKIAPLLAARHVPLVVTVSLAAHLPWRYRLPYRAASWWQTPRGWSGTPGAMRFEELERPWASPLNQPVLSDPHRIAALQPTGGTTAQPRLAMLTHECVMSNVAQVQVWSGREAGAERVLCALPFFHAFGGTVAMLGGLGGGATLLLAASFDPSRIVRIMKDKAPTMAPLVPFMIRELGAELARQRVRVPSFQMVVSGASALDPAARATFSEWTSARILEGYGLSEASPVTHCNPMSDANRPGTIGVPLPDTEVRLVRVEDGGIAGPGEVGEIVVRGPQVMSGYYNDPVATAEVLRDGWLHTGDVATLDDHGFFTWKERIKNMIKTGGLSVYPSEVESVLAQDPDVAECAVVGARDDKYGEKVVAWVVARPGHHVDTVRLQQHCRSQLAGYKVPREFRPCDAIPRTMLGKPQHAVLRAQEVRAKAS